MPGSGSGFAPLWAGLALTLLVGSCVEHKSTLPQQEGTSAAPAGDTSGDRGCPGRCRCEADGQLQRVDCSDLNLREVPANLSVFTSYLDLSMNNLTTITTPHLSALTFLEELRLAGNELWTIPRGAFNGLFHLKVLMLQNNRLTSVPAEAFNNLQNLQSLRLDANHIAHVPASGFSGLRSLRHLWLDDNALGAVPVEALRELPTLQAMTLALNHISHIPDHAFSTLSRLVVLHLNNNRIVSMGTNCFHGLHSLETLDLNFNSLVQFPFPIRSLRNLKELGFHSNLIRDIPEQAFIGNPALVTVYFHDNPIQSVGPSAFQNLPELRTLTLNGAAELVEFPNLTGTNSLESLTITGAQLTALPASVCEHLQNVQLLDLSFNRLRSLPRLSGCERLLRIDLHQNEITDLEENTFQGLMSLRSLDLSWNQLSAVMPQTFSALPALTKLDLSSNQLSSLPLTGLQSLTHLSLAGNTHLMELMAREDLPRVRVVELPYAFQCCAFISCETKADGGGGGERGGSGGGVSWDREETPDSTGTVESSPDWDNLLLDLEDGAEVQPWLQCSPAPGPFHPCLHLLDSWLIRGGVWLIAVLALLSNSLVVVSVFVSTATPITPGKRLIGLLAVVNGLMGVWSSGLAAVDAWTYGTFWRYGSRWESSFLCRCSGFLCVFAAQTSVFLLTAATLERCTTTQRTGAGSLSLSLAPPLSLLLGVGVSLPPLLAGSSSTSLCLPLPSSSSSSSLSVSLLLLDSLCFLVMTTVFTRLFCGASKAPPPADQEVALTRHVAWLLFSDCLLFLPVAFVSASSLLRLQGAGPETAKGVLLLVTPLPACVNPLLFLLFNPPARQELVGRLKRTCRLVAGSKVKASICDDSAEKQSCDSTQALVAEGQEVREEEGEAGRRSQGLSGRTS